MSHSLFIINPRSRGGKTKKMWDSYLKQIQEDYLYSFDYKIADGIGTGKEIAKNAIKEGYKTIIPIGGEGTINEVVNAIYFSGNTQVNLGFIQSGTVNDYQQVIGWPKSIDLQIEALNLESIKKTPLTLVTADEQRVALNVADAGIGATIAHMASVERRLKWIRSGFRYTLLSLRGIAKWKNKNAKITVDNRVFEGKLSLFMAGFSSQTGNYKALPHAETWGTKMAYIACYDFSKIKMIRFMGVLKKGNHTEDIEGVYMGHTRSISIETDEPLIYETDGEPFSYNSNSIKIQAIPDTVNVIQNK